MPRVIVGYGEYKGYRLTELPVKALTDLAARYPLHLDEQFSAEYDHLVITVAIHAEVNRRGAGGKPEARVPTLCELAEEIVTRGFQQASKQHHPDAKGHHEAQVRLTQARDALRKCCNNLADDSFEEGTTIIPVSTTPKPGSHSTPQEDITEDDIPF